jgi:hypothetical protein
VHQEQQRAIRYTWQTWTEAPIEALFISFITHLLLYFLPVHAEWWVRQAVVEAVKAKLVIGERVTELDVADVLTFISISALQIA